jgi:hypothetical protein
VNEGVSAATIPMSTHLRTTRSRIPVAASGAFSDRSERTAWLGRLIQIALALYLIPALLIVLVVGGMGMVVVTAARLLTVALGGKAVGPQPPVRPAS